MNSLISLKEHLIDLILPLCYVMDVAHFSFVTEASSDPSGHPQMSCIHCLQIFHDPVELLLHCKAVRHSSS